LRILAASDIHGNHETYQWLSERVCDSNVEAVVLAGDLLGVSDGFASVEEAQQVDAMWIRALLANLPAALPVFYVMGNDDWTDLDPPPGLVQSLHLTRREFGGFNFVGYQYTLPFMGGVFERPEKQIGRDLLTLEPLVDDRTVLVTHGPAAGILDSTRLGPAGSTSLRDLLLRHKIRAHIHGHIHGSFGRIDHRFNVAAGRQRREMIIDLATMQHEVLV
jgi:Icc-related predicted phosphoesterase